MFAGREKEINEFLSGIYHTKNNRAKHFLITGERGIGKSSLIDLYDSLAKGDISLRVEDYGNFSFVTVKLTVEEKFDLVTFINLMEKKIVDALAEIEIFRNATKKLKDFVRSLEISGIRMQWPERAVHPAIVANDFSTYLAKTARRISNVEAGEKAKDGIVFFIDEVDNAGAEMSLGSFFKTISEELYRGGCGNVMFVIAGSPEVKVKLYDSHPSSLRVFIMQDIEVLESVECNNIIERAMEAGNKRDKDTTAIAEDAKALIAKLSEGYPHFIQQFGYSAYECNDNGVISVDDVKKSVLQAIQSIGSQYYEVPYREKIKSDEYREVLGVMAKKLDSWVKRSEIKAKFSGSDRNLSAVLSFLTARKIILKNRSRIGEYRLQYKAFAVWIKLFGQQNGKHKKRRGK